MARQENEILNAIMDYLKIVLERRHPCYFYRTNNVPAVERTRDGIIRFRKRPKHCPKGIPDIHGVWYGKYVGIEVKHRKGKQNKDQKAFQKRVEEGQGIYFVARSIEDVQTGLFPNDS